MVLKLSISSLSGVKIEKITIYITNFCLHPVRSHFDFWKNNPVIRMFKLPFSFLTGVKLVKIIELHSNITKILYKNIVKVNINISKFSLSIGEFNKILLILT